MLTLRLSDRGDLGGCGGKDVDLSERMASTTPAITGAISVISPVVATALASAAYCIPRVPATHRLIAERQLCA